MNAWLIIALGIVVLGALMAILSEVFTWRTEWLEWLAYAFAACVAEAVVYGFCKLISWALTWDANMVVKVSFIAIPITLFLGVAFILLALGLQEKKSSRIFGCVAILTVATFVAAVIVCPVFAWVTNIGWRIGILSVLGIPWAFMLATGIYAMLSDEPRRNSGLFGGCGGYAVAEGPHGEYVGYYSSRREYKKSRLQGDTDTHYMDPSF